MLKEKQLQQQQQQLQKENQSKQTNKQIRIKRLRGPVHMNHIIQPTYLCFYFLQAWKLLNVHTLSLATTTNRFSNKYAINPDVLGVDVFPNFDTRPARLLTWTQKKWRGGGGRGQKEIYLVI